MKVDMVALGNGLAEWLDPTPSPYLDDPTAWAEDVPGDHWWSIQRQIAEAVQVHRRVAVPAGHAVGKSFVAAGVIAHWVSVHEPGEAIAITTAPSWSQVAAVLWQEIIMLRLRAAERDKTLPGEVTLDCQWHQGQILMALGRKPADQDMAGFQGLRRKHTLVVIDEACGVAKPLWTAAGTLGVNVNSRMLAIGNPDDPTSHFAEVCEGADPVLGGMSTMGWFVIPISVLDSPGFSGEEVPQSVLENMPGKEWLDEKRVEYGGEKSPLWIAKILGQFPKDADMGIIPWSSIAPCTHLDRGGVVPTAVRAPVELGIDPAYSTGGDWSVIRERRGPLLGRAWRYQVRPADLVDHIVSAIRESGATAVKIDTSGAGSETLADWLRERQALGQIKPNVQIVSVNFSATANDPTKFRNVRAELWALGRDLARAKAWILTYDPETKEGGDERTLRDLAAPRYRLDAGKRTMVELKSETKKRLGHSPDDGDAVLLAYYHPPGLSTKTTKGKWVKASR